MKYFIALVMLFVTFSALAQNNTPYLPLSSRVAIVVDASSDDVLYEKNTAEIRSIASITKLMTAVVTLDADLPPDEIIEITKDDVKATMLKTPSGWRLTSTSLPLGVKLTRAQLLHLALMNSQNRAAAALARTYPGGVEAFVEAMNKKAMSLGMTNTKYVDPTGLYNDNVSTAKDLAILVDAASLYPLIRDFSTSVSFETSAYYRHHIRKIGFGTTNRLVTKNDWNIELQKTGYIKQAGRCMVMLATFADQRIIIVLLDAPSVQKRALDAITIRKWIETGIVPSRSEVAKDDPYKRAKHKKIKHKNLHKAAKR